MDTISQLKPFLISRSFNVSRDLMWQLWTDPNHFKNWFGPQGVTISKYEMDLRPGGMLHSCMVAPDGTEMWAKLLYKEIDPPNKLTYITMFSDKDGGLARHPMSATWPLEMLTTITFTEENGQTTVSIEWLPINATTEEIETFDSARAGMDQGWSGTFAQLEAYLVIVTN